MKSIRYLLGICLVCSSMMMYGFTWNVDINPIFFDARFEPANALHVGCMHAVDVVLTAQKGDTLNPDRLSIVLYYDPESLDILRISPTFSGKLLSKIEYNKIVLDITKPAFTP